MKPPPLDDDPIVSVLLYVVYAIAAAVITLTWSTP